MRIGLTGGIASGKSFVSEALATAGAHILDSDLLAREVVAPGSDGLGAIVARFGPEMVAKSGELDRQRLAAVVFVDDEARADLNFIVHPLVRTRAAALEGSAPADSLVIQVIPLLVETGQQELFDEVVVVDVPVQSQLQRLIVRDGLSLDQARGRIAAQASRGERLGAATRIIDNSGAPGRTLRAVNLLFADLLHVARAASGGD